VTLTKDSNRTKEPCGSCRGPKESLDKLTEFYPFRTVLEMKGLYTEAKGKTSKKEVLKICDAASLKFVEVWLVLFLFVALLLCCFVVVFLFVCCLFFPSPTALASCVSCQNKLWKYCNPYISRVPDLLHHYYLGLIKKSVTQTVQLLRSQADGNGLVQRLDVALHNVRIRGLKTFAVGVLDMKGLKGWEYVDLAFLMIHGLHEVDAPSEITELFIALVELLIHLRLDEYSVRFLSF